MSHPDDLPRLLRLLGREGENIYLCHGDAHTFKASPVAFADLPAALEALTAASHNVWFEVQPTNYDRPGGRSSENDISRLATLYADLDFKESGLGSMAAAMEVVRDLSSALGVQPSAIVYTGGGLHPYWPVADGAITEVNANDVKLLLRRWGLLVRQFASANHGTVDSVYDLPRILRAPGSTNFKDPAKPVPTSVDFFDGIEPVDMEWISEVLDDYGIVGDTAEITGEVISPSTGWEWAEEDCAFRTTALQEIRSSAPTARHQWALKWSGIIHGMIRNGCLTEQGFGELREALSTQLQLLLKADPNNTRPFSEREMKGILKQGYRWAEAWSTQKLAEELRQHSHNFAPEFFGPPAGEVAVAAPSNVSSIFTRQPIGNSSPDSTFGALALDVEVRSQQRLMTASFTDTGNAEKLAQFLRGKYIWVPGMGWFEWSDGRYTPDQDGTVVEATKDMFIQMLTTAPDDAHRKWAHASLSKGRLMAAIELCKSVPHLVVSSLQLDSKWYELNTPGGIVDLRTGELRPADPFTDFHTYQTGHTPKRVSTPRFDAFLKWAIGDIRTNPQGVDEYDDTRVRYMQRLFGAAAIGKVMWHIFPIFLGIGSNGKTTLLDIMAGAFGQYAATMPQKFLVQKQGQSHPTEIAQLRGVRLAIASEVPPNARFDEDLIKAISGETRLKARYMNKDFFEFINTCTLFLAANHLPTVPVGGKGFWRRVRKIDFRNSLLAKDENPQLVQEILAEEGDGVLQWIIDGAIDILAGGLRDPESVVIATRMYQLEEDTLARYLEDRMVEMDGMEVSREAAFADYQQWAYRQGYNNPLPYIKFCREIVQVKPKANLGTREKFTNMALAPTRWQIEEGA